MRCAALIAAFLAVALADRVLLLVDDPKIKDTHSIFIKQIQDRGHKVTLKSADDSTLSLFKFGELAYEQLVIFAPSVEQFGGSLSAAEIGKFVDAGGNVLVAGDSNLGEAVRDVAVENGFEFDEADTSVIDHFNYDAHLDDGKHTTIVADKKHLTKTALIVGDTSKLNNVLFKGVALVAAKKNKLRFDILTASSTAYSFKPSAAINEYPGAVGKQILLVAGLQARNNARVVFTGSLAMFSDAFIKASVQKAGTQDKQSPSGNGQLVEALTRWVFKEAGVIRVKNVHHHKIGEQVPPREYTIMEEVKYVIELEEFKDGKWVPFQGKDVQLEFVRIDPFVRTTLKNTNGVLSTVFKLPDVYGVFKFVVDYRRPGYTHVLDVQQMSVRPLWHTQYERFIRSAYPYYASSFSMMVGLVLFSVVFLHFKEPAKAAAPQKKTN
ncbi:unnamed protein product, partial [Mesorhabditis spiculigera]